MNDKREVSVETLPFFILRQWAFNGALRTSLRATVDFSKRETSMVMVNGSCLVTCHVDNGDISRKHVPAL